MIILSSIMMKTLFIPVSAHFSLPVCDYEHFSYCYYAAPVSEYYSNQD